MTDTILVRFRDFSADTIAEHSSLLQSEPRHVWWGWWKKEAEPDRRDVLEEMREKTKAGRLIIGLFDRSTRRYFAAHMVDCLFVANSAMFTLDPEATPAYYRNEKVAAWFKLTNIEALTAAKFIERFHFLPSGGDGTLFPVNFELMERRADAKIRAAAGSRLRGSSILHISDLHFGADFRYPARREGDRHPILQILRGWIKDRRNDVGLVVVSGDLTTKGDTDNMQGAALDFLKGVMSELRLSEEFLAVVPGNHDYKLTEWRPQNYEHQRPFLNFLKLLYGQNPFEVPSLRSFTLPDGRPLDLLMMDSVRLRSEDLSNYGFVEWEAYEDLLKKTDHDADALRVAVVHHHLVPAPREEWVDKAYPKAGLSVTLDSGAVVEGLQKYNFRVVLHGHQHVPGVAKVARGRMDGAKADLVGLDKELLVVAGGSAGSSRLSDAMRDNCFNIIGIAGKSVRIECQRYTASVFPQRWFSVLV